MLFFILYNFTAIYPNVKIPTLLSSPQVRCLWRSRSPDSDSPLWLSGPHFWKGASRTQLDPMLYGYHCPALRLLLSVSTRFRWEWRPVLMWKHTLSANSRSSATPGAKVSAICVSIQNQMPWLNAVTWQAEKQTNGCVFLQLIRCSCSQRIRGSNLSGMISACCLKAAPVTSSPDPGRLIRWDVWPLTDSSALNNGFTLTLVMH